MKKIVPIALAAALAGMLLTGCVSIQFGNHYGGSSGVTGAGALERFTFETGEITKIDISLFCKVELYAAPSDTITLDVQQNLMEFIVVEESDGILTVRSTRTISPTSSGNMPVLTVSSPSLSGLTFMGAGDVTAHDTISVDSFTLDMAGAGSATAELDVENLTVSMSGAGRLSLSGRADSVNLTLAGASDIHALYLHTRESDINVAGAGTVRLSCSERLTVTAAGVGTVEYRGSPSVDVSRGGLVTVRNVE